MAQVGSDYEENRKKMMHWGYLFIGVVMLSFMVFIGRIVVLQNTDVEEFKQDIIDKNYREAVLPAARGNLFASDGSILATTVMRYDVYLDFKTMRDTLYKNNISALTDSLSLMFGKPKTYFRQKFDNERKKKNQYFLLIKGLNFDQFDRIRKFPIFSSGKHRGGFIVERTYRREIATSHILGRGTIGIEQNGIESGFEAAFSNYLSGEDGSRLEQKINASQWKPIDYWKVQEPVDGQDVYTTIDLRIQDIAHQALTKQLEYFEADHGSVVVMETKTGKVRALVNLRRDDTGNYADAYNYAVKDAIEPGSIFKPVSLLAAMDDGFVDENTKVNIGGISWTYGGQRITDSHSGGTYDISDILAQSSNIGAAKVITQHYASDPKVFFNHLRKWKLFDKMNIELPGITAPKILTPEHPRWNKATLASISYGYSTNISQLQLTTFYNGIANHGKMVKPLFIDKIMQEGKVIYEAKPEVMVRKMASEKAIQMMTDALTKAVEKGTARSIYTPNLKIAGKTGTARFEYWKKNQPRQYVASFAGFFPADDPQYTCIVTVNQPNTSIGFYGARVAAPVFKEIAGKIFLKTPLNVDKEMLEDKNQDLKPFLKADKKIKMEGNMPLLVGLQGRNAIPQLENLGYRVEYTGAGKILEQFPKEGEYIGKHQKIYLRLQ